MFFIYSTRVLTFTSKITIQNADSDSDLSTGEENPDEESTDLVLTPGKSRLGLKKQPVRVRCIAKGANSEVRANLFLVNAYPDAGTKNTEYARSALIRSAKKLKDRRIYSLLKSNETYITKLATIVCPMKLSCPFVTALIL